VKIWRNAGDYNPRLASPMTWMVAIVRNGALDLLRKKTEVSIEDEPQAIEVSAETVDPLMQRQMNEDLHRLLGCLGGLEEDHRQLVLLAYYNGWSREQLAQKFEKPVNTIKTWLRRSLIQIRECLST
jgi:RNA polymerase sigma-70 factor (ECF subfamily)